MPLSSIALYSTGFFALATVVCAICLKLIVWIMNVLFKTTPEMWITPPSFMKCMGINALMLLLVSALIWGNIATFQALVGRAPERTVVLFEYLQSFAAYIAIAMILWKMLPTTFLRALLVAAVDVIALFFVAAFFMMIMLMFTLGRTGRGDSFFTH